MLESLLSMILILRVLRAELPLFIIVVIEDGEVWCMSNRRLTELKRLQAMQQDETVGTTCIIRAPSSKYQQRECSRD
jgi:hypothetical protein